jgi:hypothetical protein
MDRRIKELHQVVVLEPPPSSQEEALRTDGSTRLSSSR